MWSISQKPGLKTWRLGSNRPVTQSGGFLKLTPLESTCKEGAAFRISGQATEESLLGRLQLCSLGNRHQWETSGRVFPRRQFAAARLSAVCGDEHFRIVRRARPRPRRRLERSKSSRSVRRGEEFTKLRPGLSRAGETAWIFDPRLENCGAEKPGLKKARKAFQWVKR